MKNGALYIFFCLVLCLSLMPTAAAAEISTENPPDPGAYEHGYTAAMPVIDPEEIYDEAVYGGERP